VVVIEVAIGAVAALPLIVFAVPIPDDPPLIVDATARLHRYPVSAATDQDQCC
jgi:hypothetical protein